MFYNDGYCQELFCLDVMFSLYTVSRISDLKLFDCLVYIIRVTV